MDHPIFKQEIIEALSKTYLSGQDIRAIVRNEEFYQCTCRNEQIVYIHQFIRKSWMGTSNAKFLSTVFSLKESNIRKILYKSRKNPKDIGRPLKLSNEQEEVILNYIETRTKEGNFITISQMLKFVESEFHIVLSYDWANTFLDRHSDKICKSTVFPQEEPRLQVPRSYLEQYIELLKQIVPLVPAELIFNMDECGNSDWEDKKPKNVIIPKILKDHRLHFPIRRSLKHATLLATISAAGDAYFPTIFSKDNVSLNIFKSGIREGIDLNIRVGNTSYVTRDDFCTHISEKFIPLVEDTRNITGCQDKKSLLFLDNCSCHLDNEMLRKLADHKVILITYPPHTSGLFQVLDRLTFSLMKGAKRRIFKDDNINPIVDHIKRIFKGYEEATTSENIRAAFEHTGFSYFLEDNVFYLKVEEDKIKNFKEFKEIWEINYPEENLSERRRNQRWGWINKDYFPAEFLENLQDLK